MTTVLIVTIWVAFGLSNFFVMKQAEKAAKANPNNPHSANALYGLQENPWKTFFVCLFVGPITIGITIISIWQWYTLSKQS